MIVRCLISAWIAILLLAAVGPACAASATPPAPSESARSFATCHGRYTAVLENPLLAEGAGDAARLRRDLIKAMMHAEIAGQDEAHALWKALVIIVLQAKSQTQQLLSSAQYGPSARRQTLAKAQVMRRLAACDTLLLDPRFSGL